ncbi:four helix bundle protein [Candidatus Daviesbacteria bacterium]|nr:four helix bundle protein [Candidatus Daviesbacteria bacterium]
MIIKSIEDLKVWQESRLLNKEVYKVTQNFPIQEKNNLISQLRRASSSVCANIAEGFGRYHPQESIQFYQMARGSILEIKSHLYLSLDQQYINQTTIDNLFALMDKTGKMLSGLINQTRSFRNNTKL